ncbi:MAG TPA: Hsp33 family molecular chaperone HslO [Candidatus Choladousia intestinavium]|uniref:33 kDa chaperonin n=1 Tax=Candidatus Choladousia intestinavium TaxID=2840727 RepID=A0A9D1DAH1_9FIRM|nr:Hsp33 family molecular chaperone HslO [Candidatus Choladousia intestinavium]
MDYMIRATAADQQIRAFAATTRETVEKAREYHNTSPVATAALGRLLSAGAMMGAMMKGEKDLLTIQVKGDGPIGSVTVTADSSGGVKGYAANPQVLLPANLAGKLDVGGAVGKGTLRVIKDLGMKEPYTGQCELQTGEIGDDLTYYFAVSEQVPSSVGLGVLLNRENTVRQAGGFIIQLMPFTSEEVIQKLEGKLAGLHSVTALLDQGMTPEDMLNELLGDFGVEFTERVPVEYRCGCSRERIEKALISIGKKELQEMISEGKTIEVNCQFCGKSYSVTVEELRELLKRAVRK